jgi:hypothetical protein
MNVNVEEMTEILLDEEGLSFYSVEESGNERLLFIGVMKRDEQGRVIIKSSNSSKLKILKVDEIKRLALNFASRGYYYKVILYTDVENESRIILREVADIEKFRLRKYLRVNVRLDLEAWRYDSHNKLCEPLALHNEANGNISGGGIEFFPLTIVPPGKKILLNIATPNVGMIQVNAKVLQCSPTGSSPGVFKIRAEFVDLTEKARDRILSYVMFIQREQIRLGIFEESK